MVVEGLASSQRHDKQSGQTPLRIQCEPIDQIHFDDLSRNVFGVLGIPLDALDFDSLLERIDHAVQSRTPFLLSTPNVNFLMMSRSDEEFRESLLRSDLCPVDGMPIVWIARLLGVPIQCRLSGADIFDALRSRSGRGGKLKVFLLGGAEGVADIVSKSLNAESGGMACVGALNPGYGSIAEMSTDEIFHTINSSCADLLTLFLSARKAQGWLLQNHDRVGIPVRAQFGATINLQAGRVKRAPIIVRRLGLEWLWRIKEEPYLWRRYWNDSLGLFFLFATSVLPLAYDNVRSRLVGGDDRLSVERYDHLQSQLIELNGAATSGHVDVAISCFRAALEAQTEVLIDISGVRSIDSRFFGLLLMFRKQLAGRGLHLQVANPTPKIRKKFRSNGFEFLLNVRG